MGLKDRDYMKREEKKENRNPKRIKPIYQRKQKKNRDYSALKYSLVGIGLITIITILATLPKKEHEKNEIQQITKTAKKWTKTVICNDNDRKCKTNYSN